jgi:hypothetical protein
MNRNFAKIAASTLLIAGLMAPTLSVHAAANTKAHVKVRVVGPNGFQKQEFLEVGNESYKNASGESIAMDKPTVMGALVDIAAQEGFDYSANSTQYGVYVTKINGAAEKTINKNTAWLAWLNGKSLDVSADATELHDGDEVVWGFTDFTQTLYPKVEFSTTHPQVGEEFTVKVTAEKTTYDEKWNATTTVVPIEGASLMTVNADEAEFVTDKDGVAHVKLDDIGLVTLNLDKIDPETRLPLIIRSGDLNVLVGNPGYGFSDADMFHWAEPEINWFGKNALAVGDGTNHFEPGRPVTRAELAKFVALLGDLNLGGAQTFPDVVSHSPYNKFIQTTSRLGLMSGDAEGTFRPDAPVTREELAVVLGRYGKLQPATAPHLSFTDQAEVSGYAAGYVQTLVDQGYLHGDAEGTFRPQAPAIRAEVAKVLAAVYKAIQK